MSKSEGYSVVDTRDNLKELLATVRNPRRTKSAKEAALGRIRELEHRDGKRYYGTYNKQGRIA